MGNLSLTPKLVNSQFDLVGNANLTTLFADKILNIRYHNPQQLDYGEYEIKEVQIDRQSTQFEKTGNTVSIQRDHITQVPGSQVQIEINLIGKS
jgi:hypothetical protein